MNPHGDIRSISNRFAILGDFLDAAPYGTGHINDTYCAAYDQAGASVRYIHQRINHAIFKDPPALMENIRRVTEHLRRKLAGQPDAGRRALTLVPARDGRMFFQDEAGDYWRTYLFIERSRTYDVVESTTQAFQAANAFGQFQEMLADLPAPPLQVTIPGFHDTPRGLPPWSGRSKPTPSGRVRLARPEIDFVLSRKPLPACCSTCSGKARFPNASRTTTRNSTT